MPWQGPWTQLDPGQSARFLYSWGRYMGPQVATVEPATIHHIPVEVELVTSEQGVQIVPRGSGQEDYVYSVTVRNAGRNTAQFRLVGGTLS